MKLSVGIPDLSTEVRHHYMFNMRLKLSKEFYFLKTIYYFYNLVGTFWQLKSDIIKLILSTIFGILLE